VKTFTAEDAKSFLVEKPDCRIAARNGVERMDNLDEGLSPNLMQCSNLKVSPTGPPLGCSIRPVGECSCPERAGDLCWFEDLAIGDCFVSQLPPGMYFKTGPESYGVAADQAEWDARDIVGAVRKHRTLNTEPRTSNGIVKVDFGTELPPLPGCGALREAA